MDHPQASLRSRQPPCRGRHQQPGKVDVNKLFKNAAEIGKASVTQKKFTMEARAAIEVAARKKAFEEAAEKASDTAKLQGLSVEGTKALRAAIMDAL